MAVDINKITTHIDTEEEFEKFFKSMNASFGFEGMALPEEEKELLKMRATGQLSREEYFDLIKKKL